MQDMGNTSSAAKNTDQAIDSRGIALVVDDGATNRLVLKSLLSKRGFEVVMAEDGAKAVEIFQNTAIDIIFMDVMMPVMDGYEATRKIKALCNDTFVPILFLTEMTDEEALAECIAAGGDDFLTKPFSHIILESKINALERFRKVHNDVNRLYSQMRREEEFAAQVFSKAVIEANVGLDTIHSVLCPARTFSGDMLLTAYTPTRDVHVLLGDFTGHGLGAALGALPVSEVFRTMTAKGFSGDEILTAINDKLHRLLPIGMFMAAQFVRISADLTHASICNCGMPDIFLIGKDRDRIKEKFESSNLALGITGSFDARESVVHFVVENEDRIILASDGVAEACSPSGEAFGQALFESSILKPGAYAIDNIAAALDQFCGHAEQADDISMVEIPCTPDLIPPAKKEVSDSCISNHIATTKNNEFEISLTLHDQSLALINPIPQILAHIESLEGFSFDREALFTVLTELYVNALDHGVLALDASIKQSAEGFGEYFSLREQRINDLVDGFIKLSLNIIISSNRSVNFIIQVEDSGNGFDVSKMLHSTGEATALCGRGIPLIQEFSKSLEYNDSGNIATVLFQPHF
jgi:CheY-like chemotaxis protein